MPRRIPAPEGMQAVERVRTVRTTGETAARSEVATAVRYLLQVLSDRAPGHAVEVRIPPFGAVQALEGLRHRRGTPPAVVQMAPAVWLDLCLGFTDWEHASAAGLIEASGERSDLSGLLPLL